ncbi:MAG TPA: hypothetical protein VFZ65_08210 [Planctomycetota bacterium]|nr:hypothetical protein [Planctomycetota bacterium]
MAVRIGSLHILQTTIQALIDLASKLCAQLGLETPRTSFEVIRRSSIES